MPAREEKTRQRLGVVRRAAWCGLAGVALVAWITAGSAGCKLPSRSEKKSDDTTESETSTSTTASKTASSPTDPVRRTVDTPDPWPTRRDVAPAVATPSAHVDREAERLLASLDAEDDLVDIDVGEALKPRRNEPDVAAMALLHEISANKAGAPSPTPPAPKSAGGDATAVSSAASVAPPAVTRGGAPAPTDTSPADNKAPPPVVRPPGYVSFLSLWHKTGVEAVEFLKEVRPEWVEKGHVAVAEGKARSVVIFAATDSPDDPLTKKIVELLQRFDELDLQLEREVIKPRWVQIEIAMDALVMSGLANVWASANTKDVLAWKEGGKNRSISRDSRSYVEQGLTAAGVAPIAAPPKIPFVYNMPKEDPFTMPRVNSTSSSGQVVMNFDKTSSTEERGGMMVVGTAEDIERIQAFVDSIDVPARRIMIEVQLVELEANKLQDLGFDSLQFGERHHIANLALPMPGDPIAQPGLGADARNDSEQFVPEIMNEGLSFFFDDTSFDLQGRFLTSLHALIREGEAEVKARPKILTLDDRNSVLHLGRDVPTFASTRLTRDTHDGNLISEVNAVSTIYAGITLNLRPRVTGGDADEVALQIEVVDNQIVGRQRVFEQDLAGIPEVVRRQYIGQARAKNHRPVILGGLIQEQDVETINKVPLLADIPYLGYLFRRTVTIHQRNEVIIIVTPHILSEDTTDPVGMPKESAHFDTFDSVLFNDRHILKGGDVRGLDPISRQPAKGPDGEPFTEQDVVDLTLMSIVRERKLVSKLGMLETYLGEEAGELNWFQRRWPESSVQSWSDRDQELFFRVVAICIENLKQLNPDLDFQEIALPRREIVLPTSPYRISLSYDTVKRVQTLGLAHVFRGEVFLEKKHVELVREAAGHHLGAFADFLARQTPQDKDEAALHPGRRAEGHGQLFEELERLWEGAGNDPAALKGVPYHEVFRKLEAAKVSFNALAAYLQAGLQERYALSPLDIGLFAVDLETFLDSTVTLRERARKLQELDSRWRRANTDDEEM